MARIRTIKPEFWDSPDTAKASPRARLLYIAMWNWADDYGIGTAGTRELLGFAFPNDLDVTTSDFQRLCKEVADCFGTVFYIVRGRPYYCIPSWDDHQKTERRAKRRNPSPDDLDSAPDLRFSENLGTSATTQGSSEHTQGSSPVGTGEQGNRGTGEQNNSCASADAEREFDEFWQTYPKRKSKGSAVKAYRAARKKASADDILAGLRRHLPAWTGKDEQFIPYPATWLNGERWLDEDATTAPATHDPWDRFRLPTPPAEIADDPAAYQQWIHDRRAEWEAKRAGGGK